MKFTGQEIFFLNTISAGKPPFGIVCDLPKEKTSAEIVEMTLQSLSKKGIIGQDGNLTKYGMSIIYSWEQYRNCKKHILLHKLRVGVVSDNKMIAVYFRENGQNTEYEVQYITAELLMFTFLRATEYLRLGEETALRGKWADITDEQWEKEAEKMDGALPIAIYQEGRLQERKVYYWKGKQGYVYNADRKRMREVSPVVMRKQIYNMLIEEYRD